MASELKPIEIAYTNYRGETSLRTITPQRVWFGSTKWHPEPQWLVTAYDHDKQAVRDFAFMDFNTRPAPAATDTGQHTICASCFVDKPTPLRRNEMGGYVCLTCVDKRLDAIAAASSTGLVTVAWESMDNKSDPNDKLVYEVKFPRNGDKRLVYQSQAEELLAAKDQLIQSLNIVVDNFKSRTNTLKADNAAKEARIKELDRCHEGTIDLCNQKTAQIEALEAKLAAAEKALEPFADHANDRAVDDTGWRDKETVKIVVSIGDLRKARAVLGGKPS